MDVEQPDIRMGTIGYASPEMYGKEKINSGSDVYSIGMVLLYMLTGMNDEGAIRRIGKGRLREIINGCICHSGREGYLQPENLPGDLNQLNIIT